MKIILNQDVYNLGEEGDVCEVANGYARNFLIPQGFAVICNNANLALFKSKATVINKRKEEKRKAALSQKEQIDGKEVTIVMNAGDSGRLFGAVTNQTIADAMAKEGIQIDKKRIDVPSHTIKMVGSFPVLVKLYEKESATITVTVISEKAAAAAAAAAAAPAEQAAAPSEEAPAAEEEETSSEA
ncbi:MAG: 50S ribosomal protein L9 [Spirochaetia bacterium]|nr:50S ribosomal protein L9 [Spirochaetia bacterium]